MANANSSSNQPRRDDGRYDFWHRAKSAAANLGSVNGRTANENMDFILGTTEHERALAEAGYEMPGRATPVSLVSMTDARSRAHREVWWDQAVLARGAVTAEDGLHNDRQTPKAIAYDRWKAQFEMAEAAGDRAALDRLLEQRPDSGSRTYRRKYDVDGFTFRLGGSKTSLLREFAEGSKTSALVDVEVTDPNGRTLKGVARVIRTADGQWITEPVAPIGKTGALVATGVNAILEAKRPTMVPRHVEGLHGRARQIAAETGVNAGTPLHSGFLTAAGYNDTTGLLVVTMKSGQTYGYSCRPEDYRDLVTSSSPGVIYNRIKNKDRARVEIFTCSKCNGSSVSEARHRCRVEKQPQPVTSLDQRERAAQRATEQARSVAAKVQWMFGRRNNPSE